MEDEGLRAMSAMACGWKKYDRAGFRDGSGNQWKCPDTAKWMRHVWFSLELPDFPNDLNACHVAEFELLSQPVPAKETGRKATKLELFEFALTSLETDKPLWAKSARTHTISIIYSLQGND